MFYKIVDEENNVIAICNNRTRAELAFNYIERNSCQEHKLYESMYNTFVIEPVDEEIY